MYTSSDDVVHREQWTVLKDRLSLCERAFLIVEFNDIMSIGETFGGNVRFDTSIEDF